MEFLDRIAEGHEDVSRLRWQGCDEVADLIAFYEIVGHINVFLPYFCSLLLGDLPCGPEEIYGLPDIPVLLGRDRCYPGGHRVLENAFIKPDRYPFLEYLAYLDCIVRGKEYPGHTPQPALNPVLYLVEARYVVRDHDQGYSPGVQKVIEKVVSALVEQLVHLIEHDEDVEVVVVDDLLEGIIMGRQVGPFHIEPEKRYDIRKGLELRGIRARVDVKDPLIGFLVNILLHEELGKTCLTRSCKAIAHEVVWY